MDEWKLGREASETLREVYTAQRMFLADNPTTAVSAITATNLTSYLRTTPVALPTVKSLTGTNLSILVNVSPPSSTPAQESPTTRPAIQRIRYGTWENNP